MESHFTQAVIIGIGLLGGSLGMALRERHLASQVVGIARRQATLDEGLKLGAFDVGTLDYTEGVRDADLIVLATPVDSMESILRQISLSLKPGALVTDVGSVKKAIVTQAEEILPSSVFFVGGHPMAGSEKSGVEAAHPDLFQDAIWAITPTEKTNSAAKERLKQLAVSVGSNIIELSPEQHDQSVAAISHLPHLVASSLVNAIDSLTAENSCAMKLASTGYRDTTRVAASTPSVWRGICLMNREPILQALHAVSNEITKAEKALTDGDAELLEQILDRASKTRQNFKMREDS